MYTKYKITLQHYLKSEAKRISTKISTKCLCVIANANNYKMIKVIYVLFKV